MPPYENRNLRDMHALMQQLDTLNAAHAPEHLEWPNVPSIPDFGITKKIKETAKAASDAYKTATGKNVDAEQQWSDYKTTAPKINVLENTFIDIIGALRKEGQVEWTVADVDALKKTIQGNSKTKGLLERNIVPNPKLKASTHRPPAPL